MSKSEKPWKQFPKWLHARDGRKRLVSSRAEQDALGPDWAEGRCPQPLQPQALQPQPAEAKPQAPAPCPVCPALRQQIDDMRQHFTAAYRELEATHHELQAEHQQLLTRLPLIEPSHPQLARPGGGIGQAP